MKDREFNLLEEPWVRVMRPDCAVAEVSLAEALLNAHEYVDLAGEMPTQDAAVLRVLLALLFAVFTRVDAEGREAPFVRPKDAIARWREIWTLGRFPEKPLRDYFARWHDRFWLFDPDYPFFQVSDKAWPYKKADNLIGTQGNVAKLNGEIFEGNKTRLFRCALDNDGLTYTQSARWLISLMAWDDTALKPKQEGLPSAKTGWLGQLGYIQAQGGTLFETLMLNLTLLKDGAQKWDTKVCPEDKYLICPCWELEKTRSGERLVIPQPKTPAALYTTQSRRIHLHRQSGKVDSFLLLGGDSFQQEDNRGTFLHEQMTQWGIAKEGEKNGPARFEPKRHDATKQFWREFSTTFAQKEKKTGKLPGIVAWFIALQRSGILSKDKQATFRICSIQYKKDASSTVYDFFWDQLRFHARLLRKTNAYIGVRTRIVEEIRLLCEEVASAVGWLGHNLDVAAGTKEKVPVRKMNNAGREAMAQFYHRIDRPFRQWLEKLDPAGDVDVAIDTWRTMARNVALALGEELVQATGQIAFVGRMVKDPKEKTERHYSAPEAMQSFMWRIFAIYPRRKEKGAR